MNPTCTHVALFCSDVEASVQFYATHVRLHEVHRRTEDKTTVVWMGEKGREDVFVVVLLGLPRPAGEGPVAHLGYAVASREEVDLAAERGRQAGLNVQGPVEAGPVVGYYCLLPDPDGNWVEFSHGQALGTSAEHA
jgi:catechol 2,3-dioxygenase-like lactoylglutathione lyase family enzyme